MPEKKPKPSIFKRLLQKTRDVTNAATKRIAKAWKKEEKELPPPVTVKAKESRIKRIFSPFVKYSPWSLFRKHREEELKEELDKLKKIKDFPEVEFEKVIPEKPPVKPLILEPEFEAERFRASNVVDYLYKRIASFAKEPPVTEVELDHALLPEGSVIVQAKFSSWDPEDFRGFTLDLEELVQSFGPGYRISIAQHWDPRDLAVPYEITKDKITISTTDLDYFKGMAEVQQNLSINYAASFDTARENLAPQMKQYTEKDPDALSLRIVWGASVSRLSRKAVRL
jgi:hypothetical protein